MASDEGGNTMSDKKGFAKWAMGVVKIDREEAKGFTVTLPALGRSPELHAWLIQGLRAGWLNGNDDER